MGLFRRRITEDTDLERLPDERLLRERERLVLDAHDPHGGAASGATFGLAADIEDVLDRRGVDYPSAEEILAAQRGGGELRGRPDDATARDLGPAGRGRPGPGPRRRRGRRAAASGARAHHADPGGGDRQPEPVGRQRRPAGHRTGVRLLPDEPRSHRGRILARPRRVGALARRGRRPLRAQDDADPRDGALGARVPAGRLRADRRHPLPRPRHRRRGRGHGLPDDPRPDHRPVVGARADEVDRAVVGDRRRRRRARAAGRRRPARRSSGGDRCS